MSCPMPTASRTLALQRPHISLPNAVISTWVHSTHAASGTSVLVAMASRVYEPPITTESHTHVLQLSEAAPARSDSKRFSRPMKDSADPDTTIAPQLPSLNSRNGTNRTNTQPTATESRVAAWSWLKCPVSTSCCDRDTQSQR